MEETNLTLLPEEQLPKTDPAKPKKQTANCLGVILREILEERGITDSEVVKATGIPWPTFWGWVTESVDVQLTDDNLFKLFKFLNVPLHYLVYGIGEDEPVFKNEEEEAS
jgi:transcriptional regulator with XRE-family HTH domain